MSIDQAQRRGCPKEIVTVISSVAIAKLFSFLPYPPVLTSW